MIKSIAWKIVRANFCAILISLYSSMSSTITPMIMFIRITKAKTACKILIHILESLFLLTLICKLNRRAMSTRMAVFSKVYCAVFNLIETLVGLKLYLEMSRIEDTTEQEIDNASRTSVVMR